MSVSNKIQRAEDVYFEINYLVSRLNDELMSSHAEGLILFPSIKKGENTQKRYKLIISTITNLTNLLFVNFFVASFTVRC